MDKAQQYSTAEVERMMKLQDVLLKAMAKKITKARAKTDAFPLLRARGFGNSNAIGFGTRLRYDDRVE